MSEREHSEQADRMVKIQNRAGLEDVLLIGSSMDNTGYNLMQLKQDMTHNSLPDYLFTIKSDPKTPKDIKRVNEDRKLGIKGILPIFENVHVELDLPEVQPTGSIQPRWVVRAGKDNEETPVIDQYFQDLVELAKDDNTWVLTLKKYEI